MDVSASYTGLSLYPPLKENYEPILEFFETASNAAFLHKDLIPFSLDNAFSVDVDISILPVYPQLQN